MKCGETLVSTHDPFTDRETAELGDGGTKRPGKRQEEWYARLATLVAWFADGGDVGNRTRGVAWSYMT